MAETAAADTTRKTTAKKAVKKTPAKKTAKKTAKRTTKKTAAKKSTPATATSAEKTAERPARKSGAKKSSSKKASARTEAPPQRSAAGRGSRVAGAAREAVLDLTGKMPEAVTGLERTDDGWQVEVEVLELERIPSTTDVLATYQVTLDEDGELEGCRRVRRYLRGSAGDE